MATPGTADDTASGETGGASGNTPRIYAACLAAYNSGRLHGRWIDATQDPEETRRVICSFETIRYSSGNGRPLISEPWSFVSRNWPMSTLPTSRG